MMRRISRKMLMLFCIYLISYVKGLVYIIYYAGEVVGRGVDHP